jgi:hypothetical protein
MQMTMQQMKYLKMSLVARMKWSKRTMTFSSDWIQWLTKSGERDYFFVCLLAYFFAHQFHFTICYYLSTKKIKSCREAEMRVRQIAALSSVFLSTISQQADEIEKLYDNTVAIGEDLKKGNEILERTNKSYVGFRIWILFFLLTCTSALLFLDWYES